jgi:hypothetical protein
MCRRYKNEDVSEGSAQKSNAMRTFACLVSFQDDKKTNMVFIFTLDIENKNSL